MSTFEVGAGRYAAVFESSKQALREFEFELGRVDARSGVITSAPRPSSGLATPWVPHLSGVGDALGGLTQFERREARIEFVPVEERAAGPGAGAGASDLRDEAAPLRGRVTVRVERVYQPGRRVDPTSVKLVSFTRDPEAVERGDEPRFITEVREDERLAARIAALIAEKADIQAK
ncbi:MAG: hypothetical protein SFZ24_01145 [Planctomycetota bacterium]|nr:hypothetical protein [Planctomycetota bacterium]